GAGGAQEDVAVAVVRERGVLDEDGGGVRDQPRPLLDPEEAAQPRVAPLGDEDEAGADLLAILQPYAGDALAGADEVHHARARAHRHARPGRRRRAAA